jgi:hypothetical protein
MTISHQFRFRLPEGEEIGLGFVEGGGEAGDEMADPGEGDGGRECQKEKHDRRGAGGPIWRASTTYLVSRYHFGIKAESVEARTSGTKAL